MTAISIWVIEDDTSFRDTVQFLLDNTTDMTCGQSFASVESALAFVDDYAGRAKPWTRPDVVLLDVNLPGVDGVEGLSALKERFPDARIVMLTIRDDAETITAALRGGASGYLLKNAGVDRILAAIREAHAGGMLMPGPVARKVLSFFQDTGRRGDYGLTDRERDVLTEMVAGRTQKAIAEQLFVSPHTVNTHVQHIYEKLHVHSGIEAVAKAVRERLVDDPSGR